MTAKKILPLRPYPSIDLEFCFWFVLRALKVGVRDLARICFKDDGLPPDDSEFEVVDVDAIDRYKGQFTSATLMQASQYGTTALPGFKTLCELLANNNGTSANTQLGGYLKDKLPRDFRPFAWVLRMVQHIDLRGPDGKKFDPDVSLTIWIARFQKVCQTWFDYCRRTCTHPDEAPYISHQDADRFGAAMPELADMLALDAFMEEPVSKPGRPARKAFRARPEALLTLTGYVIARYKLMTVAEWESGGARELREEAEDWIAAFKAAEEIERLAKEIAVSTSANLKDSLKVPNEMVAETAYGTAIYIEGPGGVKIFETPVGWGACFQTDLREAIPEIWRLTKDEGFNLLVSRLLRADGNVGIVTRAKALADTNGLFNRLSETEPHLWAHEQRLHQGEAWAVLNGAKKIPKPPTALTDVELIAVCQQEGSLKKRPEPPKPSQDRKLQPAGHRRGGRGTHGGRQHHRR